MANFKATTTTCWKALEFIDEESYVSKKNREWKFYLHENS